MVRQDGGDEYDVSLHYFMCRSVDVFISTYLKKASSISINTQLTDSSYKRR